MQEKKEEIIKYFSLLKKHGRIESSYLFIGEGFDLAFEAAKIIDCQKESVSCGNCDDCLAIEKRVHPDIFIVDNGEATIKIETVRDIQRFFSLKSFQAWKKICIVANAHRLTPEAASAFLKTLEEPPKNCFIILVTSRTDLMLPTIISRCRKVYVPYSRAICPPLYPEVAELLEGKSIYISDRQELTVFLVQLMMLMRDHLVFGFYRDRAKLINDANYEIIKNLNYTVNDTLAKLEHVLKLYGAIANININLARNLLQLTFR